MDVLSLGVLIAGRSGIGKSEVALTLIDRGHQLIADDSVILTPDPSSNSLTGSCSAVLQDYLEVRGLGILNIRAMFGDNAIQNSKPLQLIVNIVSMPPQELQQIDRLNGMYTERELGGFTIPEVSIPVAPGRHLAILVEAAVRNHRLKLQGYDATLAFREQHREHMNQLTN